MASPLVEQFRRGGASREVRMTAASGLLPLTPGDQVELLFLLTHDRDDDVRLKAEASLLAVSAEDVKNVLADRSTNPKLLAFFGARASSAEMLQAIIQNPSTEDEALSGIVPRLPTELLELVVINQSRLLRHPPIIEALEANPVLSSDQRRRLNELRHDFKLGEKPPVAALAGVEEGKVLVDLNVGPPEDEAPPPVTAEEAEVVWGDGGDLELPAEDKAKRRSVLQRLVVMTPAERMMEAFKGEREARMILVRDRNRFVYAAVLNSPKLTSADVETIASMRNLSPEVLRVLGGKREWTKQYKVKHELVKNPLTPIEVSMRLIGQLSAMDLKRLTRDRNVPEQVRRHATTLTRATR